ncbi:MAG: putative viral replication protein [Cressdnaviricota sp.]|nr:MAG: putative viral replication protein [Cressdnaviricota sp.]
MTLNAVAVWDFTLPQDDLRHTQIINGLYPDVIKKYCFQLEQGDSGYLHYQGRISLIKKRRLNELKKLIPELLQKIHLTPSSNNSREDECFYTAKLDTRLEGPWKDTDPKPIYIPRQIREIVNLYPWQKDLIERTTEWDTRNINIIYDNGGNIGKSTLTTYMGVHQLGRQLPYCNDYKDILRMVMDMPVAQTYLIDMPRAISKERLFQMYSAIETVKSGYAYDDRYHFKDKYFDCPNIWVFTNEIPDSNLLSIDRWRYWTIIEKELKVYTINDEKMADCVL